MFKNFFSNILPEWLLQVTADDTHGRGALENPEDPRDIPASAVQETAIDLPKKHVTNIWMLDVLDQGRLGACVGHAIAYVIKFFEWTEKTKLIKVSPRFIYGLSKQRDGRPDDEGTFPRVGGSVVQTDGCATEDTLANNVKLSHKEYTQFQLTDKIKEDATPRKIKGYIFPALTRDGICSAILQNGFVTASLKYGDWRKSPVKPAEDKGRHYIFIYGYETVGGDTKFYFLNSWGKNWGDDGKGYFLWSDYADNIRDVIAYTDIPNAVLEEYKAKWPYKYFKPAEVNKIDLKLVDILEKSREIAGTAFKISNGFRTVAQNAAIPGASPNSAHLRGKAVDIDCDNVSRTKILRGLLNCGTDLFIEVAGGHIHVDIDSTIHPMGITIWGDDSN